MTLWRIVLSQCQVWMEFSSYSYPAWEIVTSDSVIFTVHFLQVKVYVQIVDAVMILSVLGYLWVGAVDKLWGGYSSESWLWSLETQKRCTQYEQLGSSGCGSSADRWCHGWAVEGERAYFNRWTKALWNYEAWGEAGVDQHGMQALIYFRLILGNSGLSPPPER